MPESRPASGAAIPQDAMLARLAQSEQMREFFIQMWLQNPRLIKQAGRKVQEMLTPLATVPPACPAGNTLGVPTIGFADRKERRVAQ